jgi:hypothetical protein
MTNNDNNPMIHENENYIVGITHDYEWLDECGNSYETNYAVINKTNGIIEFYAPQLSVALFNAENFNSVLIEKPHMWQSSQRDKKVGDVIEGEDEEVEEIH